MGDAPALPAGWPLGALAAPAVRRPPSAVPLAAQSELAGPAVCGIRFANPSDGFVFGNGLWETTDGGEHWSSAVSPGSSIESLEVIDGQVLAVTATCTANGGCGEQGVLERRPLAGGAWRLVARVSVPGAIATAAEVPHGSRTGNPLEWIS